ncbi:MAG: hypothetical protein HY716_00160 [Planctomycetes bacterium]|nr:hypothetical protein [Planctomycetota bacterium]
MAAESKTTTESRTQGRQEKIEEILAVLGELYQRLGYQHASPGAELMPPQYQFMGYRPYAAQEMVNPGAGREFGPGLAPRNPWLQSFAPGAPEVFSPTGYSRM